MFDSELEIPLASQPKKPFERWGEPWGSAWTSKFNETPA